MYWPATLGHGACPWVRLLNPVTLHWRKLIPLSYKVLIADNILVRVELRIHFPLLVLEFLSSLNICRSLCAPKVFVSSYVHHSCCVWKTLFPRSHPSLLTSTLSSLLHRSLSLIGKDLMRTSHLGPSVPKSLTFCAFSSCGSFMLIYFNKKILR